MSETKNSQNMIFEKCINLLDTIQYLESELLHLKLESLSPELEKVKELITSLSTSPKVNVSEVISHLILNKTKIKLELNKLPISINENQIILERIDEVITEYANTSGLRVDDIPKSIVLEKSKENEGDFEEIYNQLYELSKALPNSRSLERIIEQLSIVLLTNTPAKQIDALKIIVTIITSVENSKNKNFDLPEELKFLYSKLYTLADELLKAHYSLSSLEPGKFILKEDQKNLERVNTLVAKSIEHFEYTYNSAVDDIESKVNDSISTVNKLYENTSKKIQDRLKNQSDQVRSMTAESIDDIDNKKADARKELQDTVDAEINDIKKRINDEVAQFEAKRNFMDQMLERVGLAKDVDVTIRQADKEEKMANDLRQKGIFLLYASVVLLVILFSGFVGIDLIADSGKTLSDLNKDIAMSRSLLPLVLLLIGFSLFIFNTKPVESQDRKLTAYTVGVYLMMLSLPIFIIQFIEFTGTALFADIKPTNKPEPEDFVFRFMTVLLVSSPALYMLKESASHRAKENLYRQRGTQLVSISGYLSDLPPEPKAEVKQRLADNFFSFHDKKADTSNVPDFLKNMNDAVKLAKQVNAGQNPQPQESRPQQGQG